MFCRRLVWLSDEDVHKGYAVDFLSLTMHAISRDTEAYPQPCIYTQVQFFMILYARLISISVCKYRDLNVFPLRQADWFVFSNTP